MLCRCDVHHLNVVLWNATAERIFGMSAAAFLASDMATQERIRSRVLGNWVARVTVNFVGNISIQNMWPAATVASLAVSAAIALM